MCKNMGEKSSQLSDLRDPVKDIQKSAKIWVNKLSDLRVRGVDPDGDRLTFGVTGRDAQLVRLEQQGDNQVNHDETRPSQVPQLTVFTRGAENLTRRDPTK